MNSRIQYYQLPESNTIATERLYLKEFTMEVQNYLFHNFNDAVLMEFLALENDKAKLNKMKGQWTMGLTNYNVTCRYFLLVLKATHEVIGKAGFHTWYLHHDRAEIGYAIDREHEKQKGYIKEAVAAIIAHGFNHMNLHRIEAMVSAENTASVRIMQRFGFIKEGTLREHYLINGKYEDSDCYGLLKTDYFPVQQ